MYVKWITNKDPLYSTEKSAQCYVTTQMEKEFEKEEMHVFVQLIHFAVHLKLTQYCQSTNNTVGVNCTPT